MANNYVVSSVSVQNNVLSVQGAVNLVPVTVVVSNFSQSNLASAIIFQNYIQPLMLAAYNTVLVQAFPSLTISFSV